MLVGATTTQMTDTHWRTLRIATYNVHRCRGLDGRTNTVSATVPADKGPWAVAINPVTNMIYVANRLSDKVTVIDGRTNIAVQR